jgi:ABC-type bacteriocin/lantibiotic exporter with double-glycine peptidase domain
MSSVVELWVCRSRGRLSALLCLLMLGCASYTGAAHDVQAASVADDKGWLRVENVPIFRQRNPKDCGAAALASVLGFWGRRASPAVVEALANRQPQQGIRAAELQQIAEQKGLMAFVFYGAFEDLWHELQQGRPTIVGVAKPYGPERALAHYEVVVGYHAQKRRVLTMDPAHGLRENSLEGFLTEWEHTRRLALVVFEPPSK